jgi:2C-methyl-D-erythritol 2,4-cyclodiphosphate synthase
MKSSALEELSNPSTNNISLSHHKPSISIMTQTIPKRHESIQLNYEEAKSTLDSLKREKMLTRSEYQKNLLEIDDKIKKNRESISKIDKKLERLETSNIKLQRSISNEKIVRIEEFKTALQPLQASADVIETTKTKIAEKIEQLKNELEVLNFKKDLQQENLEEKILELNKVQFEFQVCKRKIEEISKEHAWDHMQVFQETKARSNVARIKQEKKKIKEELSSIDFEIANLNNSVESESKKMEEFERPEDFHAKINDLEVEIRQLEEFLNLSSVKHNCKGLWEVLTDLSQKQNYSILDSIGKEQVNCMKMKKLSMIDEDKQSEWTYENQFLELNAEIRQLEVQYFENVKSEKKNLALEKVMNSKKKNFTKLNENYEVLKKRNSVKLSTINKWLEVNRKLLATNENLEFPNDEEVVQEFLLEFSMKNVEKNEIEAIQNVVRRYLEMVNERNILFFRINESGENEKKILDERAALLAQVKAEIKSKDIEREKIYAQVGVLQEQEKVLLKQLEGFKLEIDSGRRKEIAELVNQAKSGKGGKSQVNVEEIKEKYSRTTSSNVQVLRVLCEAKAGLKASKLELSSLVRDELQPKLTSQIREVQEKTCEIKSLEEDLIVLENSKEELLTKLGYLADKKREELYSKVKDLSKKHGSSQFNSIEKLYILRSSKESEIVELELESIRQQKLLSEKELKNSLEIVKVSTRAEVLERELRSLKRKQNKRFVHQSCIDIGASFLNEKSEASRFQNSCGKLKPYRQMSETMNNSESIRNSMKTPECSFRSHDFSNDLVFEIPLPVEPKFELSTCSNDAEKQLFREILPILEGTVLYKKIGKNAENFDPLEFSIKSPEDCGFVSRKFKINKQLTKIDIRVVGKPGIESYIMIDSLISINPVSITNFIIKAQNLKCEKNDFSLEYLAKCTKEYREMKYAGKVNYHSNYFIAKSRETHFYPFYLGLKTGKVELIAESFRDYLAWVHGLQRLIKNKNMLEKLKFKIKTLE